jgi:hypothetical protein
VHLYNHGLEIEEQRANILCMRLGVAFFGADPKKVISIREQNRKYERIIRSVNVDEIDGGIALDDKGRVYNAPDREAIQRIYGGVNNVSVG